MPGYFALAPRPIAPEDAAGAHQLLVSRLGVTPYVDRAVEILNIAERGDDEENSAYVVAQRWDCCRPRALRTKSPERRPAFRLHLLLVVSSDADLGVRLLDAVNQAVLDSDGRFLVAEIAKEPAPFGTISFSRHQDFEEAREELPDYFGTECRC